MISFAKEDQVNECIKRFDNRAVDNLVCNVTPYFEEGGMTRQRTEHSLLERRVYLMNVPYDATIKEIESLV